MYFGSIAASRRHTPTSELQAVTLEKSIKRIRSHYLIAVHQKTLHTKNNAMSGNHFVAPTLRVRKGIFALPTQLTTRPLASTTSLTPIRNPGGIWTSAFKDWKGASTDEHLTRRSDKGDTHDIFTGASASAREEKEENEGIADETKSQGTTRRGGVAQSRKAKKEHPEAPEPIIGMNDERAQVRNSHVYCNFQRPTMLTSCAIL